MRVIRSLSILQMGGYETRDMAAEGTLDTTVAETLAAADEIETILAVCRQYRLLR